MSILKIVDDRKTGEINAKRLADGVDYIRMANQMKSALGALSIGMKPAAPPQLKL